MSDTDKARARRVFVAALAIARIGNRLGKWRIREVDELSDDEIFATLDAIREAFGEEQ